MLGYSDLDSDDFDEENTCLLMNNSDFNLDENSHKTEDDVSQGYIRFRDGELYLAIDGSSEWGDFNIAKADIVLQ